MFEFYGWGELVDGPARKRRRQRARVDARAKSRRYRARVKARPRWRPDALPALPFAASCVFCRRGFHHIAHVAACSQAPSWARRVGGA